GPINQFPQIHLNFNRDKTSINQFPLFFLNLKRYKTPISQFPQVFLNFNRDRAPINLFPQVHQNLNRYKPDINQLPQFTSSSPPSHNQFWSSSNYKSNIYYRLDIYGTSKKAYLCVILGLYDGSIISYVLGRSNNNSLYLKL